MPQTISSILNRFKNRDVEPEERNLREVIESEGDAQWALCLPIGTRTPSVLIKDRDEFLSEMNEENVTMDYILSFPARFNDGYVEVQAKDGTWLPYAKKVDDDALEVPIIFLANVRRYKNAAWSILCSNCDNPDCPGELPGILTTDEVMQYFQSLPLDDLNAPRPTGRSEWDGNVLQGLNQENELIPQLRLWSYDGEYSQEQVKAAQVNAQIVAAELQIMFGITSL